MTSPNVCDIYERAGLILNLIAIGYSAVTGADAAGFMQVQDFICIYISVQLSIPYGLDRVYMGGLTLLLL